MPKTEPVRRLRTMMKFNETELKDAYLVDLAPIGDDRGSFTRMFCQKELGKIGFDKQIRQTNHSITKEKGTLRGMHYQISPASEVKIIRVVKGTIYDVIVDLRPDSKTYLKWISNTLSADRPQLLYVPEGFAHGFQTLSKDVEMIYQHSSFYSPEHERGFRYDDQKVEIFWPLAVSVLSKRDGQHPKLKLDANDKPIEP